LNFTIVFHSPKRARHHGNVKMQIQVEEDFPLCKAARPEPFDRLTALRKIEGLAEGGDGRRIF